MATRFRLLGEIEATVDGEPTDLGHARQRSVLAALLIEPHRPVSTAVLADRVWGDRVPSSAQSSPQVFRGRGRRLADPAVRWLPGSGRSRERRRSRVPRLGQRDERFAAELDHNDLRLRGDGHGTLLTREQPTPGRYQFHDLMRDFARNLAQETDSPEAIRVSTRRLLGYYRGHADERTDAISFGGVRLRGLPGTRIRMARPLPAHTRGWANSRQAWPRMNVRSRPIANSTSRTWKAPCCSNSAMSMNASVRANRRANAGRTR